MWPTQRGEMFVWKFLHWVYAEMKVFCLAPVEASVFCTHSRLLFLTVKFLTPRWQATRSLIRSNSCCCSCDRPLMNNVNAMNQTWWNHPSPRLLLAGGAPRHCQRIKKNAWDGRFPWDCQTSPLYTLMRMKRANVCRFFFLCFKKYVEMHTWMDVGSSVWTNHENVSFHKNTDD